MCCWLMVPRNAGFDGIVTWAETRSIDFDPLEKANNYLLKQIMLLF